MSWAFFGVLVGGFCVLAIYSFLWKENRFYRFFEHLYIGVATGYGVVETIARHLRLAGLAQAHPGPRPPALGAL